MAHIEFLDETMRDGQQSLWGLRMRAGMALPVTPLIDNTGFMTIDLTGGGMLDVLTRYCQEDYWQGLDMLVASMPQYAGSRRLAGQRQRHFLGQPQSVDGPLGTAAVCPRRPVVLDL